MSIDKLKGKPLSEWTKDASSNMGTGQVPISHLTRFVKESDAIEVIEKRNNLIYSMEILIKTKNSQLKAKDKMKFREIKLDTKEFSFNDVKEIIKAKDKEIRELKTRCRSVIRASKKDPWVLQSAIDKLSNHLNK